MRLVLLVATATLLLAGCNGRDNRAVPTDVPTPSGTPAATVAVPAPPPTTQGDGTTGAVPSGAFLEPSDLGAEWRVGTPAPPPCQATFSQAKTGSVGLRESRGTLTETIATEVDLRSAANAWRTSLSRCGYRVQDDPLGDAGVRATSDDGSQVVLVTGTEGVLVVLHVQGRLAQATDELDGWADMALGTSCVAAPDGCH